ncbi:MAG: hypothetical protein ACYDAM_06955 [Leptospirales bacterium]
MNPFTIREYLIELKKSGVSLTFWKIRGLLCCGNSGHDPMPHLPAAAGIVRNGSGQSAAMIAIEGDAA